VIREVAGRGQTKFAHQEARTDFGDQFPESVTVLGLTSVKTDPLLRPMTQFVKRRFVKRLSRLELMAEGHLDEVLA